MIYEDAAVKAELVSKSTLGHVVVEPKKKVNYLCELSPDEVVQLFFCASFSATAIFESLGLQGTNILLTEGDGLKVHIIGRSHSDGIDLSWDLKRADPEELKTTASKVKDALWYVGKLDKGLSEEPLVNSPDENDTSLPDEDSGVEDYKLSHLKRIP